MAKTYPQSERQTPALDPSAEDVGEGVGGTGGKLTVTPQ